MYDEHGPRSLGCGDHRAAEIGVREDGHPRTQWKVPACALGQTDPQEGGVAGLGDHIGGHPGSEHPTLGGAPTTDSMQHDTGRGMGLIPGGLPNAESDCVDAGAVLSRCGWQQERSGDREAVRRILFCTGKIYYDLAARRDEVERDDVAIVRLEQLYPFPAEEVRSIVASYPNQRQITWVQEEPRNHGAFFHVQRTMRERLEFEIDDISRVSSPSPSGGSAAMHEQEQQEIVLAAIDGTGPRSSAASTSTKKKNPAGGARRRSSASH